MCVLYFLTESEYFGSFLSGPPFPRRNGYCREIHRTEDYTVHIHVKMGVTKYKGQMGVTARESNSRQNGKMLRQGSWPT